MMLHMAALPQISVKKVTTATSNILKVNGLTEATALPRTSPMSLVRFDALKPSAMQKPPPRRNSTPHGTWDWASDQCMMASPWRFTEGIMDGKTAAQQAALLSLRNPKMFSSVEGQQIKTTDEEASDLQKLHTCNRYLVRPGSSGPNQHTSDARFSDRARSEYPA